MIELSQEQIDIIFTYYLMKPEDSDLKEWYSQQRKAEKASADLPVEVLRKQGFTKSQIEEMQRDVAKAAIG